MRIIHKIHTFCLSFLFLHLPHRPLVGKPGDTFAAIKNVTSKLFRTNLNKSIIQFSIIFCFYTHYYGHKLPYFLLLNGLTVFGKTCFKNVFVIYIKHTLECPIHLSSVDFHLPGAVQVYQDRML